jgi:tRNA modification GTPase
MIRTDVMNESRVMVLTPPGPAAIAVVRLSGALVLPFLNAHFSKQVTPERCIHGELRDSDGELIDDPVVVLSPDRSNVDLNLHGGPWIVSRVLALARSAGFEPLDGAAPLPEEAVDSADAIEREMLASLPLARTEPALRILLAQPSAWKNLPDLEHEQAMKSMDEQTRRRLGEMADDASLWWLLHPPMVAIVGAPNVGKSTLANQLFAQERSITADLPGTTRDWVGEIANLDGLPVLLVDMPGIGASADPIERRAIEQSAGVIDGADLVILVLDASRGADPDEAKLIKRFDHAIVVLNKIDRRDGAGAIEAGALPTIATTGQGIDALRTEIRRRFGCADLTDPRPRWWTLRQRQRIQAGRFR